MASLAVMRRLTRMTLSSNSFARVQPVVANYSKLVEIDKEVVTHTGQVFQKNDSRRARFIEREKEVNEKFAIDLINEIPPIKVKARSVWCDGGDSALGHPKVYINLDAPGPQICPYCGLRYIKVD